MRGINLFYVKLKEHPEEVIHVYAVKEDEENKSIVFLTYDFGHWHWVPADRYIPVDYNVAYVGGES